VEIGDVELSAIGVVLDVTIEKREVLQNHAVKMAAVFSNAQTAVRRMSHVEPGPGQQLARWINQWAQDCLTHSIATEIHWVTAHSGIPESAEADRQVNITLDGSGSTVR
jgi:hypothetical protein